MANNDLLSQDEIDALLSGVDSGDVDTAPELVLVGGASGSFMCAAGCGRTIAEFSSRQPRNSAVTASRTPMMIRLGMNLRVLAGGQLFREGGSRIDYRAPACMTCGTQPRSAASSKPPL